MSTAFIRSCDVNRKWVLIDAQGLVLGRLSVVIANILRGKDKAIFTPGVDCGDYVVVINAEKVALTGKKLNDKLHFWHTGYPGGIKHRSMRQMLESSHPERVIQNSVRRMLSKGPLSRKILTKLKVYKGSEHPHVAQKPVLLDVSAMNSKNILRSAA
jgi:large subunit ribosomal protein L13